MKLLRKYQLDIIFLFFALIIITWIFFYILEYFGADSHDYEWFVAGPLILLYTTSLLKIRKKIAISERRAMTNKSLIYWILLGITLFSSYTTPISAREFWSINLFFIIFTLLLADSYWDFKKMTIRKIFQK